MSETAAVNPELEPYANFQPAIAPQRAGRNKRLWHLVRSQPLGAMSALILLVIVLSAIFAPYIAPYEPTVGN